MGSKVTVVLRSFLCALVLSVALPACGMDSANEPDFRPSDADREYLQQLVGDTQNSFRDNLNWALGWTEQANSTEEPIASSQQSGHSVLHSPGVVESESPAMVDDQADGQIEADEQELIDGMDEELFFNEPNLTTTLPSEHLITSGYSWRNWLGGVSFIGAGALLSYLFGAPVYKRMMTSEFEEK